MSADPNKKSARTFQCRDVLWDTFEQLARELECSVDYLVNEAMKQYARQRSQGGARTPYPTGPGGREPSVPQTGPPPIPAPAQAPIAPPPPSALKRPTQAGRVSMPAPMPPPPGRMAPPAGRSSAAIPVPPPRTSVMPVPHASGARPTAPPPLPQAPGGPSLMPPTPAGRAMPVIATPGPAQRSVPPPPSIANTASRIVPTRDPAANGFPAPAQLANLTLVYNGERFPVTKDRFVIGRGKQSSDLTLKDPNVSRQHAVVEFQGGTYFMVDMGSTNGVAFHGQRIARRPIAEGDVYKICDHDLMFTYR